MNIVRSIPFWAAIALTMGLGACVNVPSGQGSGEARAERAFPRPCAEVWEASLETMRRRGSVPEVIREGIGGEIRSGGVRIEVKQVDRMNTLVYVNVAKWSGQDFQQRAESIADQIGTELP